MRRRTVVVLVLLAWPAAGAVGWTVFSRSENRATPAAGGPAGTGTVVGGNRSASPSPAPDGPAGQGGRPTVEGHFSISGHVADLVPGVATTLPLTITNSNPWPIRVLSVSVGVGTPADAACPASTLLVSDYAGAVVTPPRRSVVVRVPVELADSRTQDQSGCPGATFPLTFSGTAERV